MRSNDADKAFLYPLKVEILFEDKPQLEVILYDFKTIKSRLLTSKPVLWIPKSIYPDRITRESFEAFLETRLPDKTRDDIPEILRSYGLKFFNPLQMCMKSFGRNMTDYLWMRFDDMEVTFDDIRLR